MVGRAYHRCITQRIASRPASGSSTGRPKPSLCFGSGRIKDELIPRYGSPFAVEFGLHIAPRLGHLREGLPVLALFDTARQYRESFDVFG